MPAPPQVEEPEPSRFDDWADAAGRVLFPIVWLAVAIAIAFGAAGIAAALDHEPGTPARAELTWAADSVAAPSIDAATSDVAAIADLLDRLGLQGRGALAALAARDFEVLDQAVAEGGLLADAIRARSEALSARLATMPGFGPGADLTLSGTLRERHATLVEVAGATDGLTGGWTRLTSGGLAAGRLSARLERHDERITAAIEAGRAGQFDAAFAAIDEATAALDDAQELRDVLAAAVDVTTLDEWLRRNREYDVALRNLYVVSAETPDRVTPALRAAIRAEQAARANLPRTTNGLTIVMADIAQGGLNQAVIAIEEVRGELGAALTELRGETTAGS